MNTLFIIKVKILVLIKWLYRPPSIVLTLKSRIVIIFQACSLFSFKHMSFWAPFLEPHLATCYSNIGFLSMISN